MKKLLQILFFFLLPLMAVFSQPSIEWLKSIGTPNNEDGGYSIQKTIDGGYILIGFSNMPFIAKLSSNGNTEWTKTYNINFDPWIPSAICQSSSGDFFFSSGSDGITKINSVGDSIWHNTYNNIRIYSLIYTSDDFLVACGQGYYGGAFIFKLDLAGNVIWEKLYNTLRNECLKSVCETDDNGFISIGYIDSVDMEDIFVLRLNSAGDSIWTKVISSQFTIESAQDVIQNDDGSFTICGGSDQFTGNNDYDVFILKIDSNGSIIWLKTYGEPGNEWANDFDKTFDNGYILVGRKEASNYNDVYILRSDSNGDTLWTTSVGGAGDDWGWSVFYNDDKSFVVGGWSWSYSGNDDLLAIKFSSEVSDVNNETQLPLEFMLSQNYPNPFNPSTTIEFSIPEEGQVSLVIYDVLGNEVVTLVNEDLKAGSYKTEFDATNLSSGIYFYTIKTQNFIQSKKMILMK